MIKRLKYFFFPYLEPCYAVLYTVFGKDVYIAKGITFDEACRFVDNEKREHPYIPFNLVIEDMRKN